MLIAVFITEMVILHKCFYYYYYYLLETLVCDEDCFFQVCFFNLSESFFFLHLKDQVYLFEFDEREVRLGKACH